MKMAKCVAVLTTTFLSYALARGAAKTNDMLGNGNVLDKSYCSYVGLDCSSTCCIQQTCASSLSDCEYGITTDLYYMYYIAAGIICLIALFPITVKVLSLCCSIEFRKRRQSTENSKSGRNVVDSKKSKSKITFQSKIMKKLEKNHFSIDRSLDIEYLRPMGDADEIMNMYDHIDNKDKTGNDELSLDYPFNDTGRSTKGKNLDNHQDKNMVSNKPYKHNESTNKDEISEDSAGDSLELTNQRLKLDTLKTMTPIEPIPTVRKDK